MTIDWAKTNQKQKLGEALGDLLHELEDPKVMQDLLQSFAEPDSPHRDEAARLLAQFELMARRLLDISRNFGEDA